MTVFRNVMVYLGLGPDEEYDDGYLNDERQPSEMAGEHRSRPSVQTRSLSGNDSDHRLGGPSEEASAHGAVGAARSLRSVADSDRGHHDDSGLVDLGDERQTRQSGNGIHRPEPIVKAVPIPRTKPTALTPKTFGDAKLIADDFKASTPVIMNLQGLDRDLARRLIDFASGVCYALSGSMEKIASQVFLLTPNSVELSEEDRRQIEHGDFDS